MVFIPKEVLNEQLQVGGVAPGGGQRTLLQVGGGQRTLLQVVEDRGLYFRRGNTGAPSPWQQGGGGNRALRERRTASGSRTRYRMFTGAGADPREAERLLERKQ
ncbi:hypothetical protein EYF80_047853 [Liparis tanakae]|uniref:Uncharacterized protein n=1 Tax=Liparis tanakae TaxID=230148 RepID=A0A4Z2FL54_9TELE|nr:hypothetical protein EYF80_047853 [Liparis tanakae]